MSQIELSNDSIRVVLDPAKGCAITALEIQNAESWHRVLQSGPACVGGVASKPCANTEIGERGDAWGVLDRSPYSARCVFDSRSIEDEEFPIPLGAVMRIEIEGNRVEIDLDLTNLGDQPMAGLAGHHLSFSRSQRATEDELRVEEMSGGTAEFVWNKSGIRCVIKCSQTLGHAAVRVPVKENTPPPLPGVCICYNSAESPSGVQMLEPGETLSTRMTLVIELS